MSHISSLAGPQITPGQDILIDSTAATQTIGTYIETADGRGFRYACVGATALVPGKLYQSPAQDTTNQNPSGGLAVAAAAIGATQVTLTGSLTLALNLMAGGFLSVNVTPGQGYLYRIKGNTAVSSAANCVVTLDDPLVIALTTSSKVVMSIHPYNGVVVNPTTATGSPVGIAPFTTAATDFGWLQTRGPSVYLNDSSTAVGLGLAPSAGTAGALKTMAATLAQVGYAMQTGVTTEYDLCYLTIG